MIKPRLTRRESLLHCLALGSLRLAPGIGLSQATSTLMAQHPAHNRAESQWNEIGPFYKRDAPNNPQLRAAGDPGLPLTVSGCVLDNRGTALPGAKIEIWHASHTGIYDLDGYHFRAGLLADGSGGYTFHSVMPGHYPSRVCQHIHYLVTAPGHQPLITQLYFATDSVFEGDPDRNFGRDHLIISRELVRPVTLTGDPKAVEADVKFELVLDRL